MPMKHIRPLPGHLVKRYHGWKATTYNENHVWYRRLAEDGQRPRAMIVACCDSRVNMTSLLDITFLLLITFMLIAPALKHGLKINLPRTTGKRISPKKAYIVSIKDDGRIYLNNRRIDLKELVSNATARYHRDPEGDILIEGDTKAKFGKVLEVFGAFKKAGIEKVYLLTEPEK